MRDGYYKVAVGKFDLQLADHPEQLHYPMAADDVVKVIPVVSGAGGRGLGSILLGAALIGAAIVFATAGAGFLNAGMGATAGTFTLGAGASVAAGTIGLSLTLGGIATLLTPVPKQPEFGEADLVAVFFLWPAKRQPGGHPCACRLRRDDRR